MFKTVQDPIWGSVDFDEDFLKIIDTPEFQRLHWIRQLGMCYLVFPGAVHTRFQHSIGTMHVAGEIARTLHIEDYREVKAAALLHDIGHFPFSHSFEEYFSEKFHLNHEKRGRDIIMGNSGSGEIAEAIERSGMDKRRICSILSHDEDVRNQANIISGPLDADEMDYLARDSYFSGTNLSPFDFRRIINLMRSDGKNIFVEYKAVSGVESILISRFLMYKTVYFHKTVRIAQMMMERSLRSVQPREEFMEMNDFQLMDALKREKESRDIIGRIERRDLDKVIFRHHVETDDDGKIKEILEKGRIEYPELSIDLIPPVYFKNEERVKSSVKVRKDGKFQDIMKLSPLLASLYASFNNRDILVYGDIHMKEKFDGSWIKDILSS